MSTSSAVQSSPALASFRLATREDVPVILQLIRELAVYEKLEHEVKATESDLAHSLFGPRPGAEVLMVECEGKTAGFCLFFHNYSTFLGKPGLYIEDAFIRPEFRHKGLGTQLFRQAARIAGERGCGRVEWSVLDWNEPALAFYRRLGATAMDEWTIYRLDGDKIKTLASV